MSGWGAPSTAEQVIFDALADKHDLLKAAKVEHNTTAIALRLLEMRRCVT